MARFHINDIESTLTSSYYEWEIIFVKAIESVEGIFVDVFYICIVDSSLDFPVNNYKNVLLSAEQGEFVWCIFANTLNSFRLE